MKFTNRQVDQMTSFIVMDVLERANELQKEGVDIIHLEVGEPDFDLPSCVLMPRKLLMIIITLIIPIRWVIRNCGRK
ncbi:aspartate aminotransferase [Bacteroides reticulotermitis JCM 10512]|uniref:Aspartate aminotransferase n=1 Tax=Bacteroides reticulotermitis JCM 10512 TaxID=1445607 RepID=W4UVB0_9BACE|nr:aspartate aminotransferase [Bacteroides reticulotermitis JCM 10512]